MPLIQLNTLIHAPAAVCFDLARSIDLHVSAPSPLKHRAVAGVTSGLIGLGEEVTWEGSFLGVSQRMTSKIVALDAPRTFTDEMQRGPFKRWHHTHSFEPTDDSPAKRAGIEPGDVIVAADGKPTDRVSTLQRIVRTHKPGETVTFDVMRFGSKKSFRVKLAEAPDAEQQVASAESPTAPARSGGADARRFACNSCVILRLEKPRADARRRGDSAAPSHALCFSLFFFSSAGLRPLK